VPNELVLDNKDCLYPPEKAEDLFKQMKNANASSLRLVITREAVEHQPGAFNEAFLANVRKILLIAEKEGVGVFIETAKADGKAEWVNHTKRRLKNCKAVTGWSDQ
jgi:hypothetical protein